MVVGDLNNKIEPLSVDELPRVVQADRYNSTTKFFALENGEVSADSNQVFFLRVIYDDCDQKGVGFLIIITDFAIAILPYGKCFHLFVFAAAELTACIFSSPVY